MFSWDVFVISYYVSYDPLLSSSQKKNKLGAFKRRRHDVYGTLNRDYFLFPCFCISSLPTEINLIAINDKLRMISKRDTFFPSFIVDSRRPSLLGAYLLESKSIRRDLPSFFIFLVALCIFCRIVLN